MQRRHLPGLGGGLAPLVCSLGLGLGNSFALALQHDLALKLGNLPKHGPQKLPSRGAGINLHIKDTQGRPLGGDGVQQVQKVPDAMR